MARVRKESIEPYHPKHTTAIKVATAVAEEADGAWWWRDSALAEGGCDAPEYLLYVSVSHLIEKEEGGKGGKEEEQGQIVCAEEEGEIDREERKTS